MSNIGFCKIHNDKSGRQFFDIGVIQIQASEFQNEGNKRKRLQLTYEQDIQVELILHGMKDYKQVIPLWDSEYDVEFHFKKSKQGSSYSLSIFNMPLQKGASGNGSLDLKIGTVFVKTKRQATQLVKQQSKELPQAIHAMLTNIEKKQQPIQERENSTYTLRKKKGIHITKNSYKGCENCFNLGSRNICSVHKVEVDTNNMCKRFYPYTVQLGGGFSPR